jgi:hypothetical protein
LKAVVDQRNILNILEISGSEEQPAQPYRLTTLPLHSASECGKYGFDNVEESDIQKASHEDHKNAAGQGRAEGRP